MIRGSKGGTRAMFIAGATLLAATLVLVAATAGSARSGSSGAPDTYVASWDATGQQWIFNMSTKALNGNSTYIWLITLNDGSTIQFQFSLK